MELGEIWKKLASSLGQVQPVELLIQRARGEHHRRSVLQVWCRSPLGIPESGCISTIREEESHGNSENLKSSFVSINRRVQEGLAVAAGRSDRVSRRTVLGWREWIGLPELESHPTLAKMDTGAWSNTLHAEEITLTNNGMEQIVRFRLSKNGNWIERPLFDWRRVRDTGGHDTLRPVIRTTLEIAGQDHDIQLCLQDRSRMKHRIILGRRFLRQFVIDPSIDCLHPKERTTPRISEY